MIDRLKIEEYIVYNILKKYNMFGKDIKCKSMTELYVTIVKEWSKEWDRSYKEYCSKKPDAWFDVFFTSYTKDKIPCNTTVFRIIKNLEKLHMVEIKQLPNKTICIAL